MESIAIGAYSVPVLLSILLGIIYKLFATIPDKWKALIAICGGILIGLVAMLYNVEAVTVKTVIDYVLLGLMAGASSVGLYEGVYRTVKNPRE